MTVVLTDFERSCGICFSMINENAPISLMDSIIVNELSVVISSALQEIYPFLLEITKRDDCLPRNICLECLNSLKISYRFRKVCEINNQKVLEILNEHDNLGNKDIQETKHCKYKIANCRYFTHLLINNEEIQQVLGVEVENEGNDFKEDRVDYEFDIKEKIIGPKQDRQLFQDDSLVDTKYKCLYCPKIFRSLSGFNYHKETHRNKYHCDICNKQFPTEHSLGLHKHRHTSDLDYPNLCPECGKKFLTSTELVRHRRTHVDIKLYECNICLKKFSQCYNLKLHKMRHVGFRPYVCKVCDKRFTTTGNLNEHKLTHGTERPHKCNICAKTWITSSDLKKHMRTHSGEKPYSCQYCEKCFGRKETLRVHERVHTGEKPYKCNVCGKKFVHLSSLDRHVKNHCGEVQKIGTLLNI